MTLPVDVAQAAVHTQTCAPSDISLLMLMAPCTEYIWRRWLAYNFFGNDLLPLEGKPALRFE